MKRIVALGRPTVLVLLNGSALAVNWADKLSARELAYWDVDRKAWIVEAKPVEIQVGASSADIRLSREITVK